MTINNDKSSNTNTIILTDPRLLHKDNEEYLHETIKMIKDFVNLKNLESGIHSCLKVLHLKSFKRVLLMFSSHNIAELVSQYFKQIKLIFGFSRNDNVIDKCDFSNCDNNLKKIVNKDDILDPKNAQNENEPFNERYPDSQIDDNNILKLPNPVIQMQSPPPSPYEGWVENPEEPPSNVTYGYNPRSLGHLLYTTKTRDDTYENEGEDDVELRKVFSSVIDPVEPVDDLNKDLENLSLGEGEYDSEHEENNDFVNGNLFQKSKIVRKPIDVPILVIDKEEARNVKQHAMNYIDNKVGK